MKLSSLLVAAGLALGTGCNSLDSPFADVPVLQTGRDARVFNVQTGEYEWPDQTAARPRAPRPPVERSTRRAPTPSPQPAGDGRVFDVEKGEFTDPPGGR